MAYLFMALLVMSILNLEVMDNGTFLSYSVWLIMFLVITFMPINIKSIDAILNSFILGGAVIGLVMIVLPHHYLFDGSYRFTIQFMGNLEIDPNYLASFLYVAFSYAGFNLVGNRHTHKHKIFYLISIIVIGIAIIMTGSRAAYISSLIVFFGMYLKRAKQKKSKIIGVVVVILLLLAGSLILRYLPEELKSRFNLENLKDESNRKRIEHWGYAIKAFMNSPLFGFGAGHTTNLILKYTGHIGDAHNTLLTFLLHFGLIGIFVILSLGIVVTKRFVNSKNTFWICFIIAFILNNLIIANHLGVSFWIPLMLFYLMGMYPEEYIK